ncbi:MAG: transglutaminase N-terminal domain-containing protein [Methylocystis sp.]
MIYDVSHITVYSYEATVASTRCALRLIPRESSGQKLLRGAINILPEPDIVSERTDFFGNQITDILVRKPHSKLCIELTALVEVARLEPPHLSQTLPWESAARSALAMSSLSNTAPVHWLYPSRYVRLHQEITDYARVSFSPGRPILEAADEFMCRIQKDFVYDPKSTDIATPLLQSFQSRRGVCQDFAHIMLAGLRGLGLPAAYVSGYIRTIPAPGQAYLEGADASHAWISIWCGDANGWVQLDPTNGLIVRDDHIVVATGRDYADVSPIDGIIVSAGKQELDVSVTIKAV